MIFSVLKAALFGRKCTGIVTGYEICRTYRGVDYYHYIVTVNSVTKFISAENFAVYDGRKPTKHLNCEVDAYCCADSGVCTLYSPADMAVFLLAVLFIAVLILLIYI